MLDLIQIIKTINLLLILLTLTLTITKSEPKLTLTLTIGDLKVVFPCTVIYLHGLKKIDIDYAYR